MSVSARRAHPTPSSEPFSTGNDDAFVRYSVPSGSQPLFAAKYRLVLPGEEINHGPCYFPSWHQIPHHRTVAGPRRLLRREALL